MKMLVTGLLWFLLLMSPIPNPQLNTTNVSYLSLYSVFSYLLNYLSQVFHDLEELGEKLYLGANTLHEKVCETFLAFHARRNWL